jgi:hypothetical protein
VAYCIAHENLFTGSTSFILSILCDQDGQIHLSDQPKRILDYNFMSIYILFLRSKVTKRLTSRLVYLEQFKPLNATNLDENMNMYELDTNTCDNMNMLTFLLEKKYRH